jgi:DNA helicase-2/ATP-dependent DNA helicase PcrA
MLAELNEPQREAAMHTTGPLLIFAGAGCHEPNQGIMMSDGSVKRAAAVMVGDRVMGWDGTERQVLRTVAGRAPMFRVTPVKGAAFVVNDQHVLTLVDTTTGRVFDVKVRDWFKLSKKRRVESKLLRAPVAVFHGDSGKVTVEPYFLGVLLGDGSMGAGVAVSKPDVEIHREVRKQARRYGLHVRVDENPRPSSRSYGISYRGPRLGRYAHPNQLINELRELGLYKLRSDLRFVPPPYLKGSRAVRLHVLAGLLDTDGHLHANGYDWINKSKQLADDVAFLSRSVGLAAYVRACEKHDQNGHGGTYHRVSISGDTSAVPCRIRRKMASPRRQKKNVLRTGVKSVEPVGRGRYCGFSIEGDGRYLLDDFTVTHNSGKTKTLTARTVRLLQQGVRPGAMLLVTFTKKAAAEMRHRIDKVAPGATRGLVSGTFHSVCAAGLRKRAQHVQRTPSFEIYTRDEQEVVLKQVLDDMKIDRKVVDLGETLEKIGLCKQKALRPHDINPMDEDEERFREIWIQYEDWLQYGDAFDFEDLIVNMMRLAEREDEIGMDLRARFEHVMVDEFQDTNMTQYRLVRALGAKRNVCVVGDDDQGIYSWRGADRSIILGFKTDFPDARIVKLEQNYRSTKHIVGAALAVIEVAEGREPKSLWTANPDGPRVTVIECPDDREEGTFVKDRARLLIKAGAAPGDMAVLYRSHSLSRPIEDELRLAAIPYVVVGGHSFYERKEVRDVLAYLRLATKPNSDVDLIRVINRPVRGIGAGTVKKLREVAKRKKVSMWEALDHAAWSPDIRLKEREQLTKFKEIMSGLCGRTMNMRPSDMAAMLIEETRYKAMWLEEAIGAKSTRAMEDAEERAKNCDQVVESIAYYEKRMGNVGETPTVLGYLEEVALLTDQDSADAEAKMVLMTVHAAKGLEFDYVFIVGMEKGVFPHQNAVLAPDKNEERRLAYVAITRARRQLWLTYCARRLRYGQIVTSDPSVFLDDLPEQHRVWITQYEYEQKERAAMRLNVRNDRALP